LRPDHKARQVQKEPSVRIPDKVVLFNKDRFKHREYTLYHSVCCSEEKCFCSFVDLPPKYAGKRRVEANFTVPSQGHSKPLPKVVLEIPQVKADLASGVLKVANVRAEVKSF
jgi:hypothetical protein